MIVVSDKFKKYLKENPKLFLVETYLEMYTNCNEEEFNGKKQWELSFDPEMLVTYFRKADISRKELDDIIDFLIENEYYELVRETECSIVLKNLLKEKEIAEFRKNNKGKKKNGKK